VSEKLEMNLSTIGNDARRTRQGYKDRAKRFAFSLINDLIDRLNIHKQVENEAQAIFAHYRDYREQVQDEKGIVAACIIIAFEKTLQHGLTGLGLGSGVFVPMDFGQGEVQDRMVEKREQVRIESMAKEDSAIGTHLDLPVAEWTLDHVRTWLSGVANSAPDETDKILANASIPEIMKFLTDKEQEEISASSGSGGGEKKRKHASGFFHEKKRARTASAVHAQSYDHVSGGSLLVKFRSNVTDASIIFGNALRRRTDFEVKRKNTLHLIELERRRMHAGINQRDALVKSFALKEDIEGKEKSISVSGEGVLEGKSRDGGTGSSYVSRDQKHNPSTIQKAAQAPDVLDAFELELMGAL
jgi:hypothetical protein